jgi:D-amino-acid dehydrogenase
MSRVIIVGGGIVGLSSALYLQQSGWEVTVIDQSDMRNNCSYGNAGYICPSHFIPLATPGIVKQGLKWMWNSKSPFYVKPRLHGPLIDWGLKFMKAATAEKVEEAAIPLRDAGILSKKCYEDWRAIPDFSFFYQHKGLLEVYQTEEKAHHAEHTVAKAKELGLTDTDLLSRAEVLALEPNLGPDILGGLIFRCDAHCYPNDVMGNLLSYLPKIGVRLISNEGVTGFIRSGKKITGVKTSKGTYDTDAVVLSAGSWSREIAAMTGLKIPLMPGRGYSLTLEGEQFKVNYPAILLEARLAVTPMNGRTRFGGTMEITPVNTPPRMNRVEGIIEGVKRFYPGFDIPKPRIEDVWYGYRPCSADGLPYIGRATNMDNLVVATGHAMVGMSLGAGTGKLVSEILNGQSTSMDIRPFDPMRYN